MRVGIAQQIKMVSRKQSCIFSSKDFPDFMTQPALSSQSVRAFNKKASSPSSSAPSKLRQCNLFLVYFSTGR